MVTNSSDSDSLDKTPNISIIIPTLNEEKFIEQTLTQINEQSYPKHLIEIFVVDGGSTDKTYDIVKKWMKKNNVPIRILCNIKRFSSCARNMGISQAQGEYILFIDAHVFIPSKKLIEHMVCSARQRNAMVLGRAQPLTPPMLNNFQKVVAGVRSSKLGHSTKSLIYSDIEGWVSPVSIGAMYHHSVFDHEGNFDEHFDAAEDVEFNFRLESKGYKAYMSPKFKILYYPRENFRELTKQMFRYGVGRARFINKHAKGFQPELLVPISITTLLLGFCALVFNTEEIELFIIFSLLSYLAAIGIFFNSFSKIRHLLLAPACLLTIHISLAAGLLTGTIECLSKENTK